MYQVLQAFAFLNFACATQPLLGYLAVKWEKCLRLVKETGLRSIVFPLIDMFLNGYQKFEGLTMWEMRKIARIINHRR